MVASTLINSISDLLGWGQLSDITDDPTPEHRKIVRAINSILRAMQNDKDWPELAVTNRLLTSAAVSEDGVLTVARGSNIVTLSYSAVNIFAEDDVGLYISIDSSFPYRIASYQSDYGITIDRPFAGTSTATGSYKKFALSYPLPVDYDRLLGGEITILETGEHIDEVAPSVLRQNFRDNGVAVLIQDPESYAVHGLDSAGNPLINFDSAFEEIRSLEYSYQKKHPEVIVGPTATDITLLYPDRYMLYIIDQAVAKLSRDVENSAQVQQQASDAYKEAVRANSNPATGRERSVMTVDALRHGSYRRR